MGTTRSVSSGWVRRRGCEPGVQRKEPEVYSSGVQLDMRRDEVGLGANVAHLSNQESPWYEAENGSYIYWNMNDGQWWIDAPDGRGVYVVKASPDSVPAQGWELLQGAKPPAPRVE